MTLIEAIEQVVGVTMEDMRSKERSLDRLYGKALYSVLSHKGRAVLSRELDKAFTTITYYIEKYDEFMRTDPEFRDMEERVRFLYDC